MKPIIIPQTYNYIACFLTLGCNYRCSYCINHFESARLKNIKNIIPGKEWVKGINRIVSRGDLPVTLQGGEPSIHPDFIYIINNIKPELHIDILTNLQFDVNEFINKVNPNRLRRNAPYASIRVSFHPEVMELEETLQKTLKLQDAGFYIGIWGVMHPSQKDIILKAREKAEKMGIDFRTKEFLGEYQGKLYGTYKYPAACSKKNRKTVFCKTTELIIGPNAEVYRCHSDLYEARTPIGSILDPDFQIEDAYRACSWYGHCNHCDIKIKTNRFQIFGHTSVEIKETAGELK